LPTGGKIEGLHQIEVGLVLSRKLPLQEDAQMSVIGGDEVVVAHG
jgi:hypothetical protein